MLHCSVVVSFFPLKTTNCTLPENVKVSCFGKSRLFPESLLWSHPRFRWNQKLLPQNYTNLSSEDEKRENENPDSSIRVNSILFYICIFFYFSITDWFLQPSSQPSVRFCLFCIQLGAKQNKCGLERNSMVSLYRCRIMSVVRAMGGKNYSELFHNVFKPTEWFCGTVTRIW